MFDELKKLEPDFNESIFQSKVDNIFILMLNSIMFRELDRVSASLGSNVRKEVENRIEELKRNNEIQMFDELNVRSTQIRHVDIREDCYRIDVILKSRYMDYKIDATTKKLKSGDNTQRIEKTNFLTFEEKRNHKELGIAAKCPYCGASIDYNKTGVCEYCKQQMPKEEYDWILISWSEN